VGYVQEPSSFFASALKAKLVGSVHPFFEQELKPTNIPIASINLNEYSFILYFLNSINNSDNKHFRSVYSSNIIKKSIKKSLKNVK
jgi:hypothetical protein